MAYFASREITAIAMFAALWSVLNAYIAPIVWNATHMPIFCDMVGTVSLILALWWTRKFGAVTMTGIAATIITLVLNPQATQFLGFAAASLTLDALTRFIGYGNSLDKSATSAMSLLTASAISAGIAGAIIGTFFLNPNGGLILFAGLHAAGGTIGAIIGVVLIKALSTRINSTKV